jgi:adenylylsulfate kinase
VALKIPRIARKTPSASTAEPRVFAAPFQEAFAVWVTGLPACGKSTLTRELKSQLNAKGLSVAVLESDALRRILTPTPRYDEEERDTFYRQMAEIGVMLVSQGVPVIFDATAHRRAYRDYARRQIPRFLEVYVDCPLEVCMTRDPKGIYRSAREAAAADRSASVPGLNLTYEPPESPDIVIRGDKEAPETAARQVVQLLVGRYGATSGFET